MASALPSRWTRLDQFIEYLRLRKAAPYLPKDGLLVDLGCGDGSFMRFASKVVASSTGIDAFTGPSDLSPTIRILKADLNRALPLDSKTADLVTAMAILEHLEHPEVLVSESYRILRTGGLLVLTTPSPAAKPLLEFLAFRLGVISREDIRDHKIYHSKGSLLRLLSAFERVTIHRFQAGLNQLVIARK
jgi:SAM-dependent methyltransferase